MAHGKAATMDSCVEIKILLIKNEQKKKKSRKDKPERKRRKGTYCYLSEVEIGERTKEQKQILKIKVFYTFKNMEK